MRTVAFLVPGPPVAKGRARLTTINGQPRQFTPAKTVAYESKVAHAGQQAMAREPLFAGPVSIEIEARFQIAKSWTTKKRLAAMEGTFRHTSRPDADNLLKAIGDGLNGVVYIDDSQITEVRLSKRYAEGPGVSVVVREL